MKLKFLSLIIFISLFSIRVNAETIHQWEVYTISFK